MGGNTVDAFIMIDYNVDCDNHPIIVHIPTMHVLVDVLCRPLGLLSVLY